MRDPNRRCWAWTKEVIVRGTAKTDQQDAGDRCNADDRRRVIARVEQPAQISQASSWERIKWPALWQDEC